MNPLPSPFTEPPEALKKARLDNMALVPASLLALRNTYQPLANTFPLGSVLCVPGTPRQQKIMDKVTSFLKDHGHTVITVPLEKITHHMPKRAIPKPENLQLVF